MKKKKIITAVLIVVSVVVIAGISGVGYLVCNPEFVMDYFEDYHNTSDRRLIQYLEKNYEVSFPKSMTNIKAGELYTGIDGSSMFILKFQIAPNELDTFLMQFGKDCEDLDQYMLKKDKRDNGSEYLDWFLSPIEDGWVGEIEIHGNVMPATDIHIDSSNKSQYIVYLEGLYRM